jgi:hypothetical protein
MSALDIIEDGWSMTLRPSTQDKWTQLAELLEAGNCVPHETLYEMIGSELPLHLENQKLEVVVRAKTPAGLGFRFGARTASIIERAASQQLAGASPSILFALGKTLAQLKIMTPSDWLYMPMDKMVLYKPNESRPQRELRLFEAFCNDRFEDVSGGQGPYEVDFDEMDASKCVQLDIHSYDKEWWHPSDVFLFVES